MIEHQQNRVQTPILDGLVVAAITALVLWFGAKAMSSLGWETREWQNYVINSLGAVLVFLILAQKRNLQRWTAPAELPAKPALNGFLLGRTDTRAWEIRRTQQKTVMTMALGGKRETFLYLGAGHAMIGSKLKVILPRRSLGSDKTRVEQLLSWPGPHRLILWQGEFLAWVGSGDRTEFFVPWDLAAESRRANGKTWLQSPPLRLALRRGALRPEIKVGIVGKRLEFSLKSPKDYESGRPEENEVWFLAGGQRFKIRNPPLAGQTVFGMVVPERKVFYDDSEAESVDSHLLVLVEA